MTTNPIAEAFIEFRPDTSGFMREALTSITKAVNTISDDIKTIMSRSGDESGKVFSQNATTSISKGISEISKDIETEMSTTGVKSGKALENGLTDAVKTTSTKIKETMSNAGEQSGKEFANSASEAVQKNLDLDRDGVISRQIQSIGNMIKFGIGVEVANALLQVPKTAVAVAASFEQTKIAFEGILGSASKANAFLKELQTFAAVTPFEFPHLTAAAQQLLAVGYTTRDVIPMLTKIGNVAANLGASSESISLVVRALGQMKGKGKASAEELNQISENLPGFSAIAAIAAERGETVATTFKEMSNGAVPADQAIKALLKGMEKMPGAMGAMDRQSKTFNGTMSTLKDNLRNIAIDFITPKLPKMTNSLNRISQLIEHLFKGMQVDSAVDLAVLLGFEEDSKLERYLETLIWSFDELFRSIKSIFSGSSGFGKAFFESLVGGFTEIMRAVADLATALSLAFGSDSSKESLNFIVGLGKAIGDVIDLITAGIYGFKDFGKSIKEEGAVATIAGMAILSLGTAIGAIRIIDSVLGTLGKFAESVKAIKDTASKATENIQGFVKGIKSLSSKTVSIAQSGAEKATEAVKALKTVIDSLSDKTVKIAQEQSGKAQPSGLDLAKGALGGVGGFIGGAIAGMITAAIGAINLGAITSALGAVGTAIAGAISLPVLAIGAAIVGVVALIIKFHKEIGGFFTKTLPSFLSTAWNSVTKFFTETIPNSFSSGWNAVTTKFDEFKKTISEKITGLKDSLVNIFTDIKNSVIEKMNSLWGSLVGIFNGIKNFISKTITDIGNFITSMSWLKVGEFLGAAAGYLYLGGAALIGGLWIGMKFIWDQIVSWFTFVTVSIPNFFVNSYNWLYEHGSNLISGLWSGITNIWNGVSQWFIDLPGKIVSFFNGVWDWLYQKGCDLISGFWAGIVLIWNSVINWFIALPNNISNFFTGSYNWIKFHGSNLISGLWDGIKEVWNSISDWFSKLPQRVGDFFIGSYNWVKNNGMDTLRGLWDGIKEVWNSISDWFSKLPQRVGDFFIGSYNWVKNNGMDTLRGLWDGIKEVWNSISDWFKDLPNKIRNAIGDLKDLLYQTGRDLIDGLLRGITDKFEDVKKAASDIGKGFTSKFKEVTGIKSPSKVMIEQGNYLVQGLVNGINSSLSLAVSAASSLGTSVLDQVNFANQPFGLADGSSLMSSSKSQSNPISTSSTTKNYNLTINGSVPQTLLQQFQAMERLAQPL